MSITIMGQNFSPIRRTIKNNELFLVTDENGNITYKNSSGFGLYLNDTRFLSRFELKINNSNIIVLSSSTEMGQSSIVIGTNLPFNTKDKKMIPQETVQVKRESIIYGSFFETITVENYNRFDVEVELDLFFEADFLDIFEVRNMEALERSFSKEPIINHDGLSFIYHDKTGATLSTNIKFIEARPSYIGKEKVTYTLNLPPMKNVQIKYQIKPSTTASLQEKMSAYDFSEAFEKVLEDNRHWSESVTNFLSDNEDFNEIMSRSSRDVQMLMVKAYYGEYIAAGIPWFATLFGRDSVISARQTLMLNPDIAKNTLITLARFQGKEINEWRDEEPGKIPHEVRFGELTRLNITPHSPYYGSADATMLWVILFYDYFKWTNDITTLTALWENALECLNWMDNYGLYNGYIAYKKKSEKGLDNQGWKDSLDSNVHSDGTLAEAPICLTEFQGYFYAAKMRMAELAIYMGDIELRERLLKEAQEFKERFNRDFWDEEEKFFCMGLDKNMDPMKVISSNPGHCLESEIIDPDKLPLVTERLFKMDMFNGWGIRTLSKTCIAYNPLSYHNGSIWPHDNSIIAYGLSKIGRHDLALKIADALFDSARLMYYKRLPELFCGFTRVFKRHDPPVLYPVACSPQAWSAASSFLFVQSILNIVPDAQKNTLYLSSQVLPDFLNFLRIDNLKIADSRVCLTFQKTSKGIVIDVLDKEGNVDIIIKK